MNKPLRQAIREHLERGLADLEVLRKRFGRAPVFDKIEAGQRRLIAELDAGAELPVARDRRKLEVTTSLGVARMEVPGA